MGVVMGSLGFLAGLVLCGCEGQGFLVALLEGSQLVGGEIGVGGTFVRVVVFPSGCLGSSWMLVLAGQGGFLGFG